MTAQTLTPRPLVDTVIDNAKTSQKALEIAVEALLAIGLNRDTLDGRRAIEALRRIRSVMTDGGEKE